jgi:GT2 family glycosyltransferase
MWEREEDRQEGPVRQDRPIVGACVLWELAWIDRVGPLDENFRVGYGLDEADYTLRAIRRGAVSGRDERIAVSHHCHKTFGDHYVAMDNPARRVNTQAFRRKYGPEVGLWGQSDHWLPLPGIHVAVAGHNVVNWLDRCFESIETALDGFRYIVTYADDASEDWSTDIAREWQAKSRADRFLIQTFPKGKGAGEAKNRAIAMGRPYRAEYPALCLMDADDVMAPERIRHLLWQARDGGRRMVHGSHELIAPFNAAVHHQVYGPCADYQQFQGWVHPCATLIHHDLVPDDGRLFNEDLTICEDAHRFLLWYLQGSAAPPCRDRSATTTSAGTAR